MAKSLCLSMFYLVILTLLSPNTSTPVRGRKESLALRHKQKPALWERCAMWFPDRCQPGAAPTSSTETWPTPTWAFALQPTAPNMQRWASQRQGGIHSSSSPGNSKWFTMTTGAMPTGDKKTSETSPQEQETNHHDQIHGMACWNLRNWLKSVRPNICLMGAAIGWHLTITK